MATGLCHHLPIPFCVSPHVLLSYKGAVIGFRAHSVQNDLILALYIYKDLFPSGVPAKAFIGEGGFVDRFGRSERCDICAVRPALQLEEADEQLLERKQQDGSLTTVEYGRFPYVVLDETLRDLAEREYARKALPETGRSITVGGEKYPVYRLGAKEVIRLPFVCDNVAGFVRLSDGSVVGLGEEVFLEMRPVRWLYDEESGLLISCMALFGGLERDEAAEYLEGAFLSELTADFLLIPW